MRSFNLAKGVIAAAVVLGSTACSSPPPGDNQFKLRNYKDTSIQRSHVIYNYCYYGREADYVAARDFDAGEHTIIARYAFIKKYVPGGPLENYFKLNGTFEPGKIYEFKFNRDQENGTAEVWIVDAETQKAVTNKVTKKLITQEVVNTPSRQKTRCEASTL